MVLMFLLISSMLIKYLKKIKNIIQIMRDFNYKLMRGERIGVLGKNGVGKSTFLNLASERLVQQ